VKIVIVESPSKAKTIGKYLGTGYKVLASGGHVRDLPASVLGIDIKNHFEPQYIETPEKKDIIAKLKSAVKGANIVYLATDPDREGEAISWHLSSTLGIDMGKNRIEFHEISQKAVKKAIENPRELNMNLVDAQQARRVLDRLVGYSVSPILSKKIQRGLSGGRVQSASLKMIVDREREIRAFIPEEFWNIHAFLNEKNANKQTLKSLLADFNGKKLEVTNKEQAEQILACLNNANSWMVEKVKRGRSKSFPQPPFMTSTLQQDASQKLGISANEVMKIASNFTRALILRVRGI
jgi:DNA topoisomerase-1